MMIPFIFVTFLFSLFFQSCQKEVIKKEITEPQNATLKSATIDGALTFFTTPEEFPCSGLPTEDFEEANSGVFPLMANPLNENTNNAIFATGEILPGILLRSSTDNTDYNDLLIANSSIFSGLTSFGVFTQHFSMEKEDYLIIQFTNDNVTNLSMKVLNLNEDDVIIELFGNSGSLGTTRVYAPRAGTYLGVQSMEPIKEIHINAFWGQGEGVDDIAFGTCVVLDSDGDGINNDVDNCPTVANPNQQDLDGDKIGDVCDNDSDGDGINNDVDNCPSVANSDQKDLDADGIGDVCDNDTDGDGVNNDVDNCPNVVNPNQADLDRDGIGDVCDEDSDGDGCPNTQDAVPASNMEEFVNLDGCSNGVPNRKTLSVPCGTMMSDVIDGLEKGTYKNHGEFLKAISQVVNEWYAKGLITLKEKDAIMACAGESSIGVKK